MYSERINKLHQLLLLQLESVCDYYGENQNQCDGEGIRHWIELAEKFLDLLNIELQDQLLSISQKQTYQNVIVRVQLVCERVQNLILIFSDNTCESSSDTFDDINLTEDYHCANRIYNKLQKLVNSRAMDNTPAASSSPSSEAVPSTSTTVTSSIAAPSPSSSAVPSTNIQWIDVASAFKTCISTHAILNLQYLNLKNFLNECEEMISDKIKIYQLSKPDLLVNFVLICTYENSKGNLVVYDKRHFKTKNIKILLSTNFPDIFSNQITPFLLKEVEEFQEHDSGWSLVEISSLQINISKYAPLDGSESSKINSDGNKITYSNFPKFIENKKAVVNIKNENHERCFFLSVLAALYGESITREKVTKKNRVRNYVDYLPSLNTTGISCPTPLSDIPKFEKLNNVIINVYGINNEDNIVPVYLSENFDENNFYQIENIDRNEKKKRIHLLISEIGVDKEKNPVYHYSLITNLSRLLSKQISKHVGRVYLCDRCLNHSFNEDVHKRHIENCITYNNCKISFPLNDKIEFTNFIHKEKVPFVIYADLKSICQSSLDNQSKHIPCSISYYIHCSYDDSKSKFALNRGEDCIKWFMNELHDFSNEFKNIIENPSPMESLNDQQLSYFNSSENCYICEKSFQPDVVRVRNHCRFTGKFRGPAHSSCNFNDEPHTVVPVVFHNLSEYNSQSLIESLSSSFPGQLSIIPSDKEKYISFTKTVECQENIYSKRFDQDETQRQLQVKLRFIDSFHFMSTEIGELSNFLCNDAKKITRKLYPDEESFNLVTRKGVFPYEDYNSWDKLKETQLPKKQFFYSFLNDSNISHEDYEHALRVWSHFDIKTLGEYYDLYLKTGVCILADIFENFRNNCLSTYKLDPLHYHTAPGLTFDAMLKYTGVQLDILKDVEMLLFIEKGIRGGLAQCCNRYAEANNRFMKDYKPHEEESYLMYYDVNNLYGAAMCSHLPYSSFKWSSTEIDVLKIPDDSSYGYILEVDLEYPRNLFDLHKDLPLCPEHFQAPNSKYSKLMTTFYDKKNYIIHYRNLKQCISLGLNVTKIHKVLEFKQSQWLKSYIDLNANKRKEAKNKFEENFFKFMNDAVFGKTMENVRKYREVKLVKKWEGRYGAKSYLSKPNYHSNVIYNENLIAVELNKTDLIFNKPTYIGFCILDISKTFLYDFHYNYVLKTFAPKQVKLMYTDADSLIYHFKISNIYEYIKKDIHKFDTSDYKTDNAYGIPLVNGKVIGLMKDENHGKIMTHFIGLRAKMYAFKVQNIEQEKEDKRARPFAMRKITFDDYKECLFGNV